MASDSMIAAERRLHHRRPANVRARIWYGPNAARWRDCLVRDLSPGGACIVLDAEAALPARLSFAHSDEPAIFLAVVKWRSGEAAGLALQHGYPLQHCATSPLDRLAAEWRDLYGGAGA
jgi:hypothetical protein